MQKNTRKNRTHRAQLRRRREALELPVGDRPHQRRLAAPVGAAQAVARPALEAQARVVEQDLASVRERELAVAQVDADVVVVLLGLVLGRDLAGADKRLGDGGGLVLGVGGGAGEQRLEQRAEAGPLLDLEDLGVGQRERGGDGIVGDGLAGRSGHAGVGERLEQGLLGGGAVRRGVARQRRGLLAVGAHADERASGSEISLAIFSRSGSRRGRKTAASSGLSTSLAMLSVMTAA